MIGQCSECPGRYMLTPKGRVRFHGHRSAHCLGSGRLPADVDPAIAAREIAIRTARAQAQAATADAIRRHLEAVHVINRTYRAERANIEARLLEQLEAVGGTR